LRTDASMFAEQFRPSQLPQERAPRNETIDNPVRESRIHWARRVSRSTELVTQSATVHDGHPQPRIRIPQTFEKLPFPVDAAQPQSLRPHGQQCQKHAQSQHRCHLTRVMFSSAGSRSNAKSPAKVRLTRATSRIRERFKFISSPPKARGTLG
jgi:hypothetical protein